MNMDTSYIDIIIQWLAEEDGTDVESLKKTRVKPALQEIFYIFIVLYGIVGLVGTVASITMMVNICRRHVVSVPTFALLTNLAFCSLITALGVLPLTLVVLLMKNWVFGSVICFLYPMLQTFPILAVLMTLLIIVAERYARTYRRYRLSPDYVRLSIATGTVVLVWVFGAAMVLPYIFHVRYLDLGTVLGQEFDGIGLCNIVSEQEHLRKVHLVCVSLVFCFCPVITICLAFLLRLKLKNQKTKEEMELQAIKTFDPYGQPVDAYPASYRLANRKTSSVDEEARAAIVDLKYELRLLAYLTAMTLVYALCWFPLNLLTVSHQFDHRLEGSRTGLKKEITHLTILLLGFCSSWVCPIIYTLWMRAVTRAKSVPSDEDVAEQASDSC